MPTVVMVRQPLTHFHHPILRCGVTKRSDVPAGQTGSHAASRAHPERFETLADAVEKERIPRQARAHGCNGQIRES